MRIPLIAISFLALASCNQAPATDAPAANTAAANVAAPTDSKWIETVNKTPEGGMIMGNPAAPVKLVEYGALSCSHCAEFSEKSSATIKTMVASGKLSYEYRPFLLNAIDVPAFLLARCGGAGPFFPISEQLYATQREWLAKTQAITPADQKSFEAMQPVQQTAFLADKLGLIEFVKARGIGTDAAKACLADQKGIEALGKITEIGQTTFKVTGTPTFVINGSTVPDTSAWELLEPKLKAAGA
ncbi:MAG: thioredoxin domain-containing protein [Sphingomonadaceae bacterium]